MYFQTVDYVINQKIIKIDKPIEVRKIGLTSRSNRGMMRSLKSNRSIFNYESQLEHDGILLFDHDPNCVEIITQPKLGIKYKSKRNRRVEVYPDLWTLWLDGIVRIFEIKTESEYNKLLKLDDDKSKKWRKKRDLITKFCRERGWEYHVITDKKIKNQRLENVKDLIKDAKHWKLDKIRNLYPKKIPFNFFENLKKIIETDPNLTIDYITQELKNRFYIENDEIKHSELISICKSMIYYGELSIDWNKPYIFSSIKLSNRKSFSNRITPVYLIREVTDNHYLQTLDTDLEDTHSDYLPKPKNSGSIDLLIEHLKDGIDNISGINKLLSLPNAELRKLLKTLNIDYKSFFPVFRNWKEIQIEKQKMDFISPIINQFSTEIKISKKAVIDFCTSNHEYSESGLDYSQTEANRAYRYFTRWRQDPINGLKPKHWKKQYSSKFEPVIEELMEYFIQKWNNEGGFMQTHYDKMILEIQHPEDPKVISIIGNKSLTFSLLPNYSTFKRRCSNLPNKEQIGKFETGVQKEIKKGLEATYLEGRYPGCVIQIDHTKLDIWLISNGDKKAYVRPWATIAVDCYSRSIWSIYISDEPPNQYSNMITILSGLINKRKLYPEFWSFIENYTIKRGIDISKYKWNASGLPARIQVDNGKDFDAISLIEVCNNLDITLEFRPIKTPEYGGFVESIWDTINDAIRSSDIFGGKVYSLPKSRETVRRINWKVPKGYNAKKTANTTLDSFKYWLFTYLLIYYNRDKHARQNHNPNQFWSDGLIGKNYRPLGGELLKINKTILEEWRYTTLFIGIKGGYRKISYKGIQYDNFIYSSQVLRDLRKKGHIDGIPFKDGDDVEIRYHRDNRLVIWVRHNNSGKILKLIAYNYDGDDAVKLLANRAISKNISLSYLDVELFEESLKQSEYLVENFDNDKDLLLLRDIAKDFVRKGKLNKKQQLWLEQNYSGMQINEAIENRLQFLGVNEKNEEGEYVIEDIPKGDKSKPAKSEIIKMKESFGKPLDREKIIRIPKKNKNPFTNRYKIDDQ